MDAPPCHLVQRKENTRTPREETLPLCRAQLPSHGTSSRDADEKTGWLKHQRLAEGNQGDKKKKTRQAGLD